LAIGDQIGSVILADARKPKTQLAKFSIPAHRPVHRIAFNHKWYVSISIKQIINFNVFWDCRNSKLAVVGDFTEVYLFDCSSGGLKQM